MGPHTWDRDAATEHCPEGCGVLVAWFNLSPNPCVGDWFEWHSWNQQNGNTWVQHHCGGDA